MCILIWEDRRDEIIYNRDKWNGKGGSGDG